jgi:uncharacterized membrane protein YhaH (DUF805 family)
MREEIFSLIPFLIISVVSFIPALSICKRVGKTRWWAVLVIAPWIGPIVFIYIFAYSNWGKTPTV